MNKQAIKVLENIVGYWNIEALEMYDHLKARRYGVASDWIMVDHLSFRKWIRARMISDIDEWMYLLKLPVSAHHAVSTDKILVQATQITFAEICFDAEQQMTLLQTQPTARKKNEFTKLCFTLILRRSGGV